MYVETIIGTPAGQIRGFARIPDPVMEFEVFLSVDGELDTLIVEASSHEQAEKVAIQKYLESNNVQDIRVNLTLDLLH